MNYCKIKEQTWSVQSTTYMSQINEIKWKSKRRNKASLDFGLQTVRPLYQQQKTQNRKQPDWLVSETRWLLPRAACVIPGRLHRPSLPMSLNHGNHHWSYTGKNPMAALLLLQKERMLIGWGHLSTVIRQYSSSWIIKPKTFVILSAKPELVTLMCYSNRF